MVYGILVLEKTDAHEDMLVSKSAPEPFKEVLPSEPSRTTVRDTNKNNGPRIWVQGNGAKRNSV